MLKTWRIQNIRQMPKTWRLGKLGASKILGIHRNVGAAGKVGGLAEELPYCLGSAESALLTSPWSR